MAHSSAKKERVADPADRAFFLTLNAAQRSGSTPEQAIKAAEAAAKNVSADLGNPQAEPITKSEQLNP